MRGSGGELSIAAETRIAWGFQKVDCMTPLDDKMRGIRILVSASDNTPWSLDSWTVESGLWVCSLCLECTRRMQVLGDCIWRLGKLMPNPRCDVMTEVFAVCRNETSQHQPSQLDARCSSILEKELFMTSRVPKD